MICWTCHEPCEGPKCVGCGALQPPPPQPDLFGILGLERRYRLEPGEVDKAWRARSRLTHPDRYSKAAAVQRRMALQWTASLNEARRALRETVARAWYLATGSARPPETGGPRMDGEFLERIFDLRMTLMEEPEEVREQVETLYQELDRRIAAVFAAWEGGRGDLVEIPDLLSRLKYVNNLRSELEAPPTSGLSASP